MAAWWIGWLAVAALSVQAAPIEAVLTVSAPVARATAVETAPVTALGAPGGIYAGRWLLLSSGGQEVDYDLLTDTVSLRGQSEQTAAGTVWAALRAAYGDVCKTGVLSFSNGQQALVVDFSTGQVSKHGIVSTAAGDAFWLEVSNAHAAFCASNPG